jgi:hypothetical protein
LAERVEITQEKVLTHLWQTLPGSQRGQAVFSIHSGITLGKHLGMFVEKVEAQKQTIIRDERFAQYSTEELQAFINARRAAIESEHGPMLPVAKT